MEKRNKYIISLTNIHFSKSAHWFVISNIDSSCSGLRLLLPGNRYRSCLKPWLQTVASAAHSLFLWQTLQLQFLHSCKVIREFVYRLSWKTTTACVRILFSYHGWRMYLGYIKSGSFLLQSFPARFSIIYYSLINCIMDFPYGHKLAFFLSFNVLYMLFWIKVTIYVCTKWFTCNI